MNPRDPFRTSETIVKLAGKHAQHHDAWQRLWTTLHAAVRHADAGDLEAARKQAREAERMEYELTGDCEVVGELVTRLGFPA